MADGAGVAPADGDRWCILRTSGGRTLTLARSLVAAGIDAWTPMLVTKRRRPRSKATIELDAPILPTFVFARERHLPDLYRVLAAPRNPHPDFSIFRHAGRIPVISGAAMASLRAEEEREASVRTREAERSRLSALKARGVVPPVGSVVRVPQMAFTGMTGVVEGARGRAALVNFGGGLTMTIDAWLLAPDELRADAA